jgi:hypothetical protein
MTDIGYIVGTAFAVAFLLVGAAAIAVGFRFRNWEPTWWVWFGIGVAVIVLAAGLWTWGAFPPFDMEYHQWRPVSGQVEHIDSRLIASGDKGGSTQDFVVVIDGREYRCDDSRCATVHPGDTLTLRCQRVWEYASTPGYVCRFVDVERKLALDAPARPV